MSPFTKASELVQELEPAVGVPMTSTLPGYPSVVLNNAQCMKEFLEKEFCSQDLETMAPRLWIMTTFSSGNINPLHRQRVKGREIIVTEEPCLHFVWIRNRIFVKPLPRFLLSYTFWKRFLSEDANPLGAGQDAIRKAATGFLRTYRYLIQHESDFNIAQQDHLRLIPKGIDWDSFCRFISGLDHINDSSVSTRYHYGELRLTRLNFYAPFLLRKFHFEQVHGQYGDFFGRLYGPILFAFAVVSTILNSMQVALTAEQLVTSHWQSVWYVFQSFSIVSLIGAAIISMWFVALWLWIFLGEWIYTIRRKIARRARARRTSSY
jgi:hypothetical protein